MKPTLALTASVAFVGLVGAAGYSLYSLGRSAGRPSKTTAFASQSASQASSTSENDVARLADQLSATQRRLDSLESTAKRPPEPEPPKATAPPARRPVSREEMERRQARRVERVEEAVQSEPRDASWAPTFEKEIQQAVQDAAGAAGSYSVKALSCRTSVCRMELSHQNESDQLAFLQKFQTHLPYAAATHLGPVQRGDGSFTTVAHFVRVGYPIPGADEEMLDN
jgi:hypothetical protein